MLPVEVHGNDEDSTNEEVEAPMKYNIESFHGSSGSWEASVYFNAPKTMVCKTHKKRETKNVAIVFVFHIRRSVSLRAFKASGMIFKQPAPIRKRLHSTGTNCQTTP